MMNASARRSAGVVVMATVVALGTWAVVRLLGVELTVGKGPDPSQVGAVEVAAATVLANAPGAEPSGPRPDDG